MTFFILSLKGKTGFLNENKSFEVFFVLPVTMIKIKKGLVILLLLPFCRKELPPLFKPSFINSRPLQRSCGTQVYWSCGMYTSNASMIVWLFSTYSAPWRQGKNSYS